MRPPISSTKNDGVHSVAAPLHRKTQINQKEILAENQNVKNYLTKNSNTINSSCETIEIISPIPILIDSDTTSITNDSIFKSQQDSLISQSKQQQQKLFVNFNENPATSSTGSLLTSSNDTIGFNSTTIPSQLFNSNNTITSHSSDSFQQQLFSNQEEEEQAQQQQFLNDSINLRKLKRLSSDVSDNRLKNNCSNQFNNFNNTFVSDNFIKTNSDLDSLKFDRCSLNLNNTSTTSEINLVNNYVPDLITDNNTINNIQYKNVPSNNIININSNIKINNTNESIITNFEYPHKEEEYKQVEFYYKNEKNNPLLSTTITTTRNATNNILTNKPLDKEPLLKLIDNNITDINETNRNIYLNKNSASLILNKNNKDLAINNDKFSDYKINNCNNFNNNINNSHNNIIKSTISTTTTSPTEITAATTTSVGKNNYINERRSNGANIRNNYNNINIYNNSCDTVTYNAENFEKSKKRKSFPINNYVQNFKPINNSNIDLFETDQLINQSPTATTTANTNRKQLSYSWYAPVYSALQEEIEQDSRDSSPIHNLANLKKKPFHSQIKSRHDENNLQSIIIDDNETEHLLQNNNNQIHIQPQTHQISSQKVKLYSNGTTENTIYEQETFPSKINLNGSINNIQQNKITTAQKNETSRPQNPTTNYQQSVMGANQIPRKKRFENFIKTLVGRKPSKELPNNTMPSQNQNYYYQNQQKQQLQQQTQQQQQTHLQALQLQENTILDTHRTYPPPLPSPEITIAHSSSQDFTKLEFSENGTVNKNNDIYFETGSNLSTAGSAIHICDSTKITQSSTLSLNTVQQKLWNFMPLLKREGSATSLYNEKSQSIVQYTGLRKCETVLALSSKSSSLYNQIPSNYNYDYNSRASVPAVIYNRCVSYNPSGINNYNNNNNNNNITIKRDSNSSCNGIELPIKPLNRLRNSSSITNANCSRCSSLLSITASSSRYSLNNSNNNSNSNNNNNNSNNNYFNNGNNLINNNNNNNDNNIIKNSCTTGSIYESLINSKKNLNSSSYGITRNESITSGGSSCVDGIDGGGIIDGMISSPQSSKTDISTTATLNSTNVQQQHQRKSFNIPFVCKLCLNDVNNSSDATIITQCNCSFCTECIKAYVEFEISEGAYEISCPDAQCPSQGIISLTEIATLASAHSLQNHHRYRLNREIELDKTRTWCPRAGCETICLIGPQPSSSTVPSSPISSSQHISTTTAATLNTNTTAIVTVASVTSPSASSSSALFDDKVNSITTMVLCSVQCPTCHEEFCSGCKKAWHPNITCEENNRRLTEEGQDDLIGIPFDNDLIKSCPMCAVPIEKDEGCAQMMCKRCKHVFCWYCLASLDDDFLLRHYDKGPCKNKLGHSRASVVWHRAQVIGIFAGFGILLLVASPLLLLAAPCIICCKCRICSGGNTKLDDPDADFDDAIVLQR